MSDLIRLLAFYAFACLVAVGLAVGLLVGGAPGLLGMCCAGLFLGGVLAQNWSDD